MKKVVKTGLLLFGFVAIVIASGSSTIKAGGNDKVLVNHRNGNGTINVICVSVNAVPGHLTHGDEVVPIGDVSNP